jgi:hypothetical protein
VLRQDSHGHAPTLYGAVNPGLFDGVVNKYMHSEPAHGTHPPAALTPSMATHHMTNHAME